MAPRDDLRLNHVVPTGYTDIYRDLLDGLDGILWEIDPATLQFTLVSQNAEALLGYPVAAWTDTPSFWAGIIHPDDRPRALAACLDAITRCADHRLDYRVITKDGRTRWIRDVVRVTCEAGRAMRVYGVMIDVTPASEATPVRDEPSRDDGSRAGVVPESSGLEGQLRQGQKMEAVGRLAGGIAHDFNNLLTVIIGYAELVLQQLAAGTPLHADVEEIRHAGTSAASLTRQLLAFSRKQILEPQILDLNTVVWRTNTLLRRLIGEDVELRTQLAAPLDRVSADPGQIEQIILNLALNARDAMPQGGILTIETANTELDAAWVAQYPDASAGRHVMLAVTDTGIGMDQTVRSHLFEPFFTTKERGKGTGLGLAIVYGIVKHSGGSILVRSEPGEGTGVKIFLPRSEQTAEPASPPRSASRSLDGTETIMVVEDHPDVRGVTRNALVRHGYTVLAAAGGVGALSLVDTHEGAIDLLLTDVVMRGMSGRELADRVVARRPGLRVLYTSGYTDDTMVQHGVLHGEIAFIHKPFTPTGLMQKIRDLLDAR
jgi:two-component system cell cycle sensor histidine kinase/response regulator CckA